MSRDDEDLTDLLGPDPVVELAPAEPEITKPKSRPMGTASRELLERSRSYDAMRVTRKNTPERLARILNAARELPVQNSICLRANISITTLKYWLQKSKEGAPGDGFDILLTNDGDGDVPSVRFHEAWDSALQAGVDKLEQVGYQRSTGYREVLTHKGRVIYQENPDLIELGYTGAKAYLLDEFGAPVPETVEKIDPDLLMFMLKSLRPGVYGQKGSIDVNVRGGVLVVGTRVDKAEDLNKLEESYFANGRPKSIAFVDDEEDPV